MSGEQPTEAAILALLADRGGAKPICPSEAARRLSGDAWRASMDEVHAAARSLAERGDVRLEQRQQPVAPGAVRGAYRIARAR